MRKGGKNLLRRFGRRRGPRFAFARQQPPATGSVDPGVPFWYPLAAEIQPMDKNTHAVLDRVFNADAQRELRHEDSQAWSAVTGILFLIVTAGAILGLIGVLFSL
jgi:hypothetical protein